MNRDIRSSRPFELKSENPSFVCVISYTATCEIPGITVAGANPSMLKFTPAADAEYLSYGQCKCIEVPPATPDGKPTPAVITRAALNSSKIPVLIACAGPMVKPSVPCIDFALEPGRDISQKAAMDRSLVDRAFNYGKIIGLQLSRNSDLVVIGESIPGGTTTALAVLCALGIDAKFKVSSSMTENPHQLKNKVVDAAFVRDAGKSRSTVDIVSSFGDPMMPSVAGLANGVVEGGSVALLAGGTQMAAVLAVLKDLCDYTNKVCIGTTKYVFEDKASSLTQLVDAIDPDIPILACDPHLDESSIPGLSAYAQGFVKEGVGAGGACIASMKKTGGHSSGYELLRVIENEYRTQFPMMNA